MNNQRVMITLFPTCIRLLYVIFMVLSHCKRAWPCDWKRCDNINLNVERYDGEYYIADCELENSGIDVSLWQDNGNKKERVPNKSSVKKSGQVFNITKLTSKDIGNYYCKSNNMKEKSLGNLYIASDGKAFQTPEILIKSNITYGSSFSMDCEVTGYYEMKWYTSDGSRKLRTIDASLKRLSFHITKQRLIFESFTEDDDGLYTCEVRRRSLNWKATDNVNLTTGKIKPTLQKNKKIQFVSVNNTQEFKILRCKVNAYPPAVFEWYECIYAFYNCSNKKVGWFKRNGSSTKYESSLNITSQLKFHKVSYRCTAKNELGGDTYVQETLNENGIGSVEPQITKTPKFEIAGANITMVCQSNYSVIMKWMKNTQTLQSNDASYKQHGFAVTRKIHKITNFSRQDEGMYRCKVSVREFNWSDTNRMNVIMRVKPKITERKGNGVIKFKKGIQLNCKLSTKDPRENISWTWSRCLCDGNCIKCNTSERSWFETENTSSIPDSSEVLSTLKILQQTSDRMMYRCRAKNEIASDELKWIVYKGDQEKDSNIYLVIMYCIIVLMIIFLIITAIVLYRRKKLYGGFYILTVPPLVDYIAKLDEEKSLIEQSNKLPYISEWEFPRERVQLEKDVGKGAFGKVYLAKVIGISAFNPREVLKEKSKQNRFSVFYRSRKRNSYLYCTMASQAAVKMLNDNWNESELSDLLTELKLLIHVGQHNNVVNILGACTKGPRGNAWIIMEYCEHGNLSQFLKDRRPIFETGWLKFSEDQNILLSNSDLAAIALQVVFGMKFLVSRKCIHRDLAARNVLIADGFVPKIADFGLARDVYMDGQYNKTNSGLLPIKWMSIEAIRDMTFSEKSDVWSFGIFLWEIFSMGGSPYLGIPASEIYEYLLQGNRMKPPSVCPSEIYDVMLECWITELEERPDFKTMEENLTKILVDKNRPWSNV